MRDLRVQEGSFLHRVVASNEELLNAEPGLQSFATDEAVVLVGSFERIFKVCHVRISKSGSLHVQAPYFAASEGVVGSLRWAKGAKSVTAAFEPGWAKATTHLVKLTHPPDGNAHFSQDTKVNTEIWRQTFPLASGSGFVFQFNLYGIEGHEYIAPSATLPANRVHLPFLFDGEIPPAVIVFGEWLRKDDLRSKNVGQPTGPLTYYADARGSNAQAFLLSQPATFPLQDHVLRVTCGGTVPIDTGGQQLLLMQAAWDANDDRSGEGGCLAFMYPVTDHDRAIARLGSIDRTSSSIARKAD